MGWLIFLGVLVLLGCLPLGVRLNFDEGGFRAAALIGRIPVRLYPVPRWLRNMPSRHKKEEQSPEPKPKGAEPQSREQPGVSGDSSPLSGWVWSFWGISAGSSG